MAHRGEEGALRLSSGFRLVAGTLQLRDVVVDPEEADPLLVDAQRDEHQLDIDRRPVLSSPSCDPVRPSVRKGFARDVPPFVVDVAPEDEVVDLAADRLVRRMSEQLRRRRVPACHALLRVHDDDRDRTDLDERLEVLALPLDLRKQSRVLDCDADVRRDRGQQAGVGLGETSLLADALHADRADCLVTGEDRHAEIRPRGRADAALALVFLLAIEEERLARLEDLRREPFAVPKRWLLPSLAGLVVVDEVDLSAGLVVQGHVRDVGLERRTDALADELDQGVELEPCCERLADAVHGGQLCHALAGLVNEPRVVERDAEAAGERRQEPLIVLGEGVRAVHVLERDDACRAPADDEGDEECGLHRLAAQHIRIAVALGDLRGAVLEHQRLSRLHDVPAEADQRDRLLFETLTALDHIGEVEQSARFVVDRDAHDLGIEDLLQPVADEAVDRPRIELAGDRRLDAVDQCQFGISLPSLVHETRVLERHAEAAGERGQQADVVLRERVRAVDVLQRDPAAHFVPGDQRSGQHREHRFAHVHGELLAAFRLPGRHIVDQKGRLGLEQRPIRRRVQRRGLVRETDASLDRVRVMRESRLEVEHADVDNLGVEDLLDLVADDVVDRLKLELTGERVLDAVDQRQLGVALACLVYQPRVLERDAQASGQRLQELLVGIGECVLPVEVLERDHARRLAARTEGHVQHRLRHLARQHRVAVAVWAPSGVLVDQERLAGLDHVAPEPDQLDRLVRISDAALDRVREAQEPRGLVMDADVDDLSVEDLLELVADEVVDCLRVELAGDRRLNAVDQRELGVALSSLVYQPRVLERDAQASGQRLQELLVGVGERVFPVEVLERNDARGPPASYQRARTEKDFAGSPTTTSGLP